MLKSFLIKSKRKVAALLLKIIKLAEEREIPNL